MDSSGSMKRTDPARLRVPAAQLFLSLLDAGDRAALVSFSDAGYPVVRLSAADSAGRERLVAGTDKVSSKGAFTNLHAALEQGMALLDDPAAAQRRRYLILLSDGRMDTGDPDRDEELNQRIERTLIPALRERGIKVYSIAFTDESDIELLRAVAVGSGGLFQLIERKEQLHQAFADIFEDAKAPNMLPMHEGTFEVDASIEELTVVAAHDQGAGAVTLLQPDGQTLRYREHPAAVRWMHSPQFDLVTVPAPATGTWILSTDSPGNRAYVVTELALRTELQRNQLQQGEPLTLRTWLTDQGKPLVRPEVLSTTEYLLQLDRPDGAQQTIALGTPGADGVASATVPMNQTGTVRVTVIARSATFERQTKHLLQVTAQTAPAAFGDPQTPAFVIPPIQLPVPTVSDPETSPASPTAELKASDKPAATTPESASSTAEPLHFTTVVLVFLLVNAVLAVVVGTALMLRHRRRRRAAEPTPDSED